MEFALCVPVVLLLVLGLLQFGFYVHARNVVTAACADGALVAAAADGSVPDGITRAQDLLRAGLGPDADQMTVQGTQAGRTMTIEAQGAAPSVLPVLGHLAVHGRASATKEGLYAP